MNPDEEILAALGGNTPDPHMEIMNALGGGNPAPPMRVQGIVGGNLPSAVPAEGGEQPNIPHWDEPEVQAMSPDQQNRFMRGGRSLIARLGLQARAKDAAAERAQQNTAQQYWGAVASANPLKSVAHGVLSTATAAARLTGKHDLADELEGYIGPSTEAMAAEPTTMGQKVVSGLGGLAMWSGVPISAGAFGTMAGNEAIGEAKAKGASNLAALTGGAVTGGLTTAGLKAMGYLGGKAIPGLKAPAGGDGEALPWEEIISKPANMQEIAKGVAFYGGGSGAALGLAKYLENLYAKHTYEPNKDLTDGVAEQAITGFGLGLGHLGTNIEASRLKDAILNHPEGPTGLLDSVGKADSFNDGLIEQAKQRVAEATDPKAKADAQALLEKSEGLAKTYDKVRQMSAYVAKTKAGKAAQEIADARPEPEEPNWTTPETGDLDVVVPKAVPTLGMNPEYQERVAPVRAGGEGGGVGSTPMPGPPPETFHEIPRMEQIETRMAEIAKNPTAQNVAERIQLINEYLKLKADTNVDFLGEGEGVPSAQSELPGPGPSKPIPIQEAVPTPEFERRGEPQSVPVEQREGERRQNPEVRKRVSEMTPEEMQKALLTSDKSGLGNRRAFEEAPPKPVKASMDVDSLKWVNDNLGHQSGDLLLGRMGDALRDAGMGNDAFHVSGDEFWAHGNTKAEIESSLQKANEYLQKNPIQIELPDGSTVSFKGGFSHGTGESIEQAETGLQAHKSQRESEGARASRGNEPPGVSRSKSELGGNEVQGEAGNESQAQAVMRRQNGDGTTTETPLKTDEAMARYNEAMTAHQDRLAEIQNMRPAEGETDTTREERAKLYRESGEQLAQEKSKIEASVQGEDAAVEQRTKQVSELAKGLGRLGELGAVGNVPSSKKTVSPQELSRMTAAAIPGNENAFRRRLVEEQMARHGVKSADAARVFLHPADMFLEQTEKRPVTPPEATSNLMDSSLFQLEQQHKADMIAAQQLLDVVQDRYKESTLRNVRDYMDQIEAGLKPDNSKMGPAEAAALQDLRPLMEAQGSSWVKKMELGGAKPDSVMASESFIPRVALERGGEDISGKQGKRSFGAMKTKSGSEIARSMVVGTDSQGHRFVVSDGGETGQVWVNGKPVREVKKDADGNFIMPTAGGNEKLQRGPATQAEIEQNTNVRYLASPFASTVSSMVDLNNTTRTLDLIKGLKDQGLVTPIGRGGLPDGWQRVYLRNFQDSMAPKGLANSLNALEERLTAAEKQPNAVQSIARMLSVNLGFLNPSVHLPNMFDHYMGGGGLSKWMRPGSYDRVGSAFDAAAYMARDGGVRNRLLAMNANINPLGSKLAVDLMNAGMPWMNATPETSAVLKGYMEAVGREIGKDPQGFGFKSLAHVQKVLNTVGDKVWLLDNMARTSLVLDYAATHKIDMNDPAALKKAVDEVGRAGYVDYKIPSQVMGSRGLSRFLQSDALLFMRYHYGAMRLLKNKIADPMTGLANVFGEGAEASLKRERGVKAIDKLAMLGLLNAAIYPLLTKGIQAVTGDEQTEFRKGGTSHIGGLAVDVATGKKDLSRMAATLFTPSPEAKLAMDLARNENMFTKRKVLNQSALYRGIDETQAGNYNEAAAAYGRVAGDLGVELGSMLGPWSQWNASTYNRLGEEKTMPEKLRHFAGSLVAGKQTNELTEAKLPGKMAKEYKMGTKQEARNQ